MIRHARSTDRADEVLVFEREEQRLGGFVELGLRRYADGCTSSPVAYLEGIRVDEDLRGTGVGRDLCAASVRWARDRGITELASDTELENVGSQAFHRAVGFEETGRMVCFRVSVR